MQFKSLRKQTLAGYGHVIAFDKGEVKFVPGQLHAAALDMGLEPELADGEQAPDVAVVGVAKQEEERIAKIKEALAAIRAKNDRADFTAGGVPTAKAIEALSGAKPANSTETVKLWGEVSTATGD